MCINIPVPGHWVLISFDQRPLDPASYMGTPPQLCLCLQLWLLMLIQRFVIKSLEEFCPLVNKNVLLLTQKSGNAFERVIWFSIFSIFKRKSSLLIHFFFFFFLNQSSYLLYWLSLTRAEFQLMRILHLISAYRVFERSAVQMGNIHSPDLISSCFTAHVEVSVYIS